MQINIDTTKLPEGMTRQEVFDHIFDTMSNFIGDYRRPGYDLKEEEAVMNALIDPETETQG